MAQFLPTQMLGKAFMLPPFILPFFAGLLLTTLSPDAQHFFGIAKLYLFFLILFGIWSFLRVRVPLLLSPLSKQTNHNKSKWYRRFVFIALLVLFVFLLGSMELIHNDITDYPFYLLLIVLGAGAIGDKAKGKGLLQISILIHLIYFSGASYLSFLLLNGQWLWQPLLFSLGIAANAMSLRTLQIALEDGIRKDTSQLLLMRYYPILFVLSSLFPTALVYFSELPRSYLALILLLPLGNPQLVRMRKSEELNSANTHLLRSGAHLASLYVATMIILQLL